MKTIESTKKKNKTKSVLTNHDVVVLAAYLAGAQSSSADTEDIAIKANDIAPGRFTWRKYKDQINIDTVRKRLWDATNPKNGAYLIGSEKTGWRLTKAGFDFAKAKLQKTKPIMLQSQRLSQNERSTKTREINRLLQEVAFIKFQSGKIKQITKADAERFFRIDDYVVGNMRKAKIERFKILAGGQSGLVSAIDFLSTLVREA